MKITITDGANAVRLDYNDVVAPNIFYKTRIIPKAGVRLNLAVWNDYVEVVHASGDKEQFNFDIFEGFTSNQQLFEHLATMLI